MYFLVQGQPSQARYLYPVNSPSWFPFVPGASVVGTGSAGKAGKAGTSGYRTCSKYRFLRRQFVG